jgi:Dr1-associated corepressor
VALFINYKEAMSDGTYAPKSPDLSSFYSTDATPPTSSQFQLPDQGLHYQPTGSPAAVPGYYTQGSAQNLAAAYTPPVGLAPSQPYDYPRANEAPSPIQQQQAYGLHSPSAQPRQPYFYPSAYEKGTTSPLAQNHKQPQPFPPAVPPISTDTSSYRQPKSESSPTDTTDMPPRRSAAAAAAQQAEIEPSPVRTKFPTARIKRIMQADDEVGKVAQQTPIAVGKALELFMVALVSKSAEVARDKSSKRVSAQMLKQVVESDDQWDFLRDIVGKVENEEKAGKGGRPSKNESESDDEIIPEKKKGRPGRKKKAQ